MRRLPNWQASSLLPILSCFLKIYRNFDGAVQRIASARTGWDKMVDGVKACKFN